MLVTAEQLFNTALEISGYNTNDIFETSNIGERLLSIVNTIYSDLYYLNGKKDKNQNQTCIESGS